MDTTVEPVELDDSSKEVTSGDNGIISFLPHSNPPFWDLIKHSLQELIKHVNTDPSNVAEALENCICSYRTDYDSHSCHNFFNLHAALDKYSRVSSTHFGIPELITSIAQGVLRIENIDSKILAPLSSGINRKVDLAPEEVHAILCNAFFCTFLHRDQFDNFDFVTYPRINFIRLFCDEHPDDFRRNAVKVEKLLCLLAYFEESTRRLDSSRKVTYERRCTTEKVAWESLTDIPFHKVTFSVGSAIEDQEDALQVDFANKSVGGGVLGNGTVQEEIRFITCPEMIGAQLITEHLGDDEVLFLDMATRFSIHSGYARTFRFERIATSEESAEASVVAMDAMYFGRHDSTLGDQFKRLAVDRELHKCHVAFGTVGDLRMISSGKWGCGAFGGDPELKIILQWMASSYHKRPITFHLPDLTSDDSLAEHMRSLEKLISDNNLSVGQIYDVIISHGERLNSGSLLDVLQRGVLLQRNTEESHLQTNLDPC